MIDESKRWPESFPDIWASEWGEDEYGLWMAFHYKKIRHVMRWIEPGTFMMGSPEDEAERGSWGADETLHQVTLSEGFWLGATTVTHELWEAVTGENPSEFKGAQRPVEQVSWEGTQKFMARLNKEIPGLELDLPTEAQWEYASEKGKYCGKTFFDIEELSSNTWGLHQMHGDMEEWCRDWLGDYPSGPVVNPVGPSEGRFRVCRGGSWYSRGRLYLYTYRYGNTPDYCGNDLGFRLSRGRTGTR
ncbi:Formylglycine-generating enzyme [Candidatus Electrothrix laxa]